MPFLSPSHWCQSTEANWNVQTIIETLAQNKTIKLGALVCFCLSRAGTTVGQLTKTPAVVVLCFFSLILTVGMCMPNLVLLQPFLISSINVNTYYENKSWLIYSTQLTSLITYNLDPVFGHDVCSRRQRYINAVAKVTLQPETGQPKKRLPVVGYTDAEIWPRVAAQ